MLSSDQNLPRVSDITWNKTQSLHMIWLLYNFSELISYHFTPCSSAPAMLASLLFFEHVWYIPQSLCICSCATIHRLAPLSSDLYANTSFHWYSLCVCIKGEWGLPSECVCGCVRVCAHTHVCMHMCACWHIYFLIESNIASCKWWNCLLIS